MPFEGGKDKDPYWGDDKKVRIAEYWKKEPITKTLYLTKNPMGEIFTTEMKPDTEILAPLGAYWESLHPKNRWGGNFSNLVDCPHFERNVG